MMKCRFIILHPYVIFLLMAASPYTHIVSAASLDDRLYHQIHDRWQRPWLNSPMSNLTTIGDVKAGLAICAGVGLFGGQKGYEAAKLALTADAGSAMIAYGLKNTFNRQRPEGETIRSNSSFPSGHATGAFTLATVFSHEYPKLTVPLYALASGVALSRIYLGRHYPTDVLASAVIGVVTARVVLHYRKLVLSFGAPVLGYTVNGQNKK